MPDIQLRPDATGIYDIAIENGDFVADDGLETSLIVALLSDARADESQVPQPERRRGWIGDLVAPVPGYQYGSLLWLLEQARLTQETLAQAENNARAALNWMVEDGLAQAIDVIALRQDGSLILDVTVTSPDGSIVRKAFDLWRKTLEGTS